MDEIQAAVLCVKLQHLDGLNAERRQIIACYAAATGHSSNLVGGCDPTNVGHLAILRTPNRPAVAQAMSNAGIATDVHYPVLDCDQESARAMPGRKMPLPVSERARDEILTLPCYPGLTPQELERVARVLATCSCPLD